MGLYALVMLRLDIKRHSQLPTGPMIYVVNHPSATDPFMIHLITRRRLNVLITAKAFSVPVFGWFLKHAQEIPVPLVQGSSALEEASRYIKNGRSVVIFIEGDISPMAGGFHRPHSGAARLAISTGSPVVPVGIFLHRERCLTIRSKIAGLASEGRWYLRGPYAITVGKPTCFEGDANDREHLQHISEVIMEKIRRLASESEGRIRRQKSMPAAA